jgi:hypothetical protein
MIYIHAESVHLAENFARVDLGLSRREYRAFGNWSRLQLGMRYASTDRVIFYGPVSREVEAVVGLGLRKSAAPPPLERVSDGR